MSISSVIHPHQNPSALAQISNTQTSTLIDRAKPTEVLSASATNKSHGPVNLQTAAASIMAKYDLTNITYSDMNKLGRELVAAGALPEDKLLDFIPLDPTRISLDGTIHEGSATPMNMIEQQQGILSSIKEFGGKGADYANMVLTMYKNFQALHDHAVS